MKNTRAFLILLAQFSLTLFANEPLHSAKRNATETYQHAEKEYWDHIATDAPSTKREGSASQTKKKFAELNFDDVVSTTRVNELFTEMRDERFLTTKDKPDFIRRLSWLYPQDGCWIRAALMKQLSTKWKEGAPHKLFIFGNLSVKTENAPGGSVSWWYHVVPIFRDGDGKVTVVDPAIDPTRPLPVKDWILTQVPEVDNAQFSVCSPETYTPSSPCDGTPDEDKVASSQIVSYLDYEWQNLVSLKRDPEKELGDSPPWKN